MNGIETYIETESTRVKRALDDSFGELLRFQKEPLLRRFLINSREHITASNDRFLSLITLNSFKGIAQDSIIDELSEEMYKIASAVELLKASSQIHSDFIDGDEIRDGKPTFHKLFRDNIIAKRGKCSESYENAIAIYGGNLIGHLGQSVILQSSIPNDIKTSVLMNYNEAMELINQGLILESSIIGYYNLNQLTLEQYMILASMKRGLLMEYSASLGAKLARGLPTQITPIKRAMNSIGISLQILNDVEGSFGESSSKSTKADIINGKPTILTILAYQGADETTKNILDSAISNHDATEEQIESVKKVYIEKGIVEFSKIYAGNLYQKSIGYLNDVYPGMRTETLDFFETLFEGLISTQ